MGRKRKYGRINVRRGQGFKSRNFEPYWPDMPGLEFPGAWAEGGYGSPQGGDDLWTLSTPGGQRPANDNVRDLDPAPANDNERRGWRKWREHRVHRKLAHSRMARALGRLLRVIPGRVLSTYDVIETGAELVADWGPRTRRQPALLGLPSGFPKPGSGQPFVWRHGPNSYPGTGGYSHGVPTGQRNGVAFISGPPWGPETAHLSGQANGNTHVFGSTPALANNQVSLWIQSTVLTTRWAQFAAWERAVNATDVWRAWNDEMPVPIGAPARSPYVPLVSPLPAQFPSMYPPLIGPKPTDAPAIQPRHNRAIDNLRNLHDPSYPRVRVYDITRPGVDQWPGVQPSNPPVIEVPPVGKPNPLPEPGPHRREPPGPRVKERKIRTKTEAVAMVIGGAFGAVTEVGDLIQDLWNALPKKYKRYSFYKGKPVKPSKYNMLKQLYRHWDKVDMNVAVENWAKSQASDAVIGALTSGLRKNYASKFANQLVEDYKDKRKKDEEKRKRNPWLLD